jgi:hypothetical protein
MNELQGLKDLLAKPPAAQAVRDEGRHRLQNVMLGGPGPSRRRKPWLAGGLGVTAAAVAAVVAVVSAGSPAEHKAAPNSPPPAPLLMSATEVLSSAATNVGRQPSAGAYWRISTSTDLSGIDTGRGYTVQGGMKQTLWLSGSPKGTSWMVSQGLGWAPKTPADIAAWKADGSPTTWRVDRAMGACPPERNCKDLIQVLSGKDQPVQADRRGKPGVVGTLGDFPITLAQVRALPSDPAKLKAAIARRLPGARGELLETITFENGIQVITQLPVSSAVRAGAYRMMASLPGVKALGEFTDPLGRKGQAVTMGADGSAEILHRVIIDPKTGLPLTTQMYRPDNGQVVLDQTVTFAGWTNAKPDLNHA